MHPYNHAMRVVGVTGTIGAGKSTVARWLEESGAVHIDSDALVRELYESDAALQSRLRERFGSTVLSSNGVDRRALGAVVFADAAALRDLEQIVHPAVQDLRDRYIRTAREAGAPACVVEAIKLIESGGSAICDELWIVVAAEAVQLSRLQSRGVVEVEARRRLRAQGSPAVWIEAFREESARMNRPRPVVVFDNSGPEDAGRAQARRLWHGISAPEAGP